MSTVVSKKRNGEVAVPDYYGPVGKFLSVGGLFGSWTLSGLFDWTTKKFVKYELIVIISTLFRRN